MTDQERVQQFLDAWKALVDTLLERLKPLMDAVLEWVKDTAERVLPGLRSLSKWYRQNVMGYMPYKVQRTPDALVRVSAFYPAVVWYPLVY